MAILNFLKKPQKDRKLRSAAPKPSGKKEANKKKGKERGESVLSKIPQGDQKAKRGQDNEATASVKLKESRFAWRVLVEPRVTERSTDLTLLNQYTFLVYDSATKPDIKRAVHEIYDVDVESVRKIKSPRKKRGRPTRRSKQTGWRSGYTKAVVELKKGDKIEVLPH